MSWAEFNIVIIFEECKEKDWNGCCDICGQLVQCRGDETFAIRNHANRSPYHKKCVEEIRISELEKEREANKQNKCYISRFGSF